MKEDEDETITIDSQKLIPKGLKITAIVGMSILSSAMIPFAFTRAIITPEIVNETASTTISNLAKRERKEEGPQAIFIPQFL